MRRTDKEVTDPNVIRDILIHSKICRLGLVDNGEAYIVPVNYVYEEGSLFVHSAGEGRKMEILERDSKVAFEIEIYSETVPAEIACKWGTKYRSVMGLGTVTILRDSESKRSKFDMLMKKYGDGNQLIYDESALEKSVILQVKVDSCTGKQSGDW